MHYMKIKCDICGYIGNEIEVDDHMLKEHTTILED